MWYPSIRLSISRKKMVTFVKGFVHVVIAVAHVSPCTFHIRLFTLLLKNEGIIRDSLLEYKTKMYPCNIMRR